VSSLPDWLRQRASLTPNRLALAAGEARWSFRELDARATRTAQNLVALGVGAGERVALLLGNGAPFVILIHAVSRLGAISVPLNTRLTPAELQWQLNDASARLLIFDDDNARAAHTAAHELPDLRLARADEAIADFGLPTSDFPLNFPLDKPHSLLYTSGTAGRPKGAVLTYGNHWWSAVGSALNLGLREDDRWLACLPLFHVGGLAILLRSVIYGCPAMVHESFDPAAVNRAVDADGVTHLSVVSVMLQKLLAARGAAPYPPTLRCVLLGGGPCPRVLLEECARRGVPVVQTYGLTEAASQVATLAPEDALRKLGSAGKPLFPTEIKIEREAGDTGEIVVRGPTVTPGYWASPRTGGSVRGGSETRPYARPHENVVTADGWLHTGDIGYLDDEGYLYVLDRRDDLIISGGENVYPAEIESVLRSHPAVEEAGVTGMADDIWGQVPAAFVVLRSGESVTAEDLRAFCAERLARYKIPARFEFVESLPRNAAGKLLRRRLMDR
jgi:O-succinylbenzoic acid--CoA ligase